LVHREGIWQKGNPERGPLSPWGDDKLGGFRKKNRFMAEVDMVYNKRKAPPG